MANTAPRSLSSHLVAIWQGVVVAVLILLTLILTLVGIRRFEAPNYPILLFVLTIIIGAVLMVVHWPTVFRRLPAGFRAAGYVGIIGYFFQVALTANAIDHVWKQTPAGAQEHAELEKSAAAYAAQEAELAAAKKEADKLRAESEQLQTAITEYSDKLERCFNWRNRLPALEQTVRDSLHNPRAFEHIKTVIILPDSEQNDVAMTFRAENGFGALRTVTVRAQVLPDTCEIASVGEIEEI